MALSLPVVRAGAGAPIVLVHGSAADHLTWSIQLRMGGLRDRFLLCAYDRRREVRTVGEHADDLAAVIEEVGAPVVAVGSSFGAVCVLELARRRPDLLRGAVLCEPPLPATDHAPAVPDAFLARFDELVATVSGEAAAEHFLRTVLGDAAYQRMPWMFQIRSQALWREIRDDCAALGAYRVAYDSLAQVATRILVLGGERSAAYFRPTVDALADALGAARAEILPGAGHMMQADAPRRLAEVLIGFCAEVGHG